VNRFSVLANVRWVHRIQYSISKWWSLICVWSIFCFNENT